MIQCFAHVGLFLRLTALSSMAWFLLSMSWSFHFYYHFLMWPRTCYFIVTQSWVLELLFLLHCCPPISQKLSNVTHPCKKYEWISLRMVLTSSTSSTKNTTILAYSQINTRRVFLFPLGESTVKVILVLDIGIMEKIFYNEVLL